MATFTTSNIFTELVPNPGYKELIIETPATWISSTDRARVTLVNHGITAGGFISINGYGMSGTYGIVVTEAPITSVIEGILTISGTATGLFPSKHIFRIIGKST